MKRVIKKLAIPALGVLALLGLRRRQAAGTNRGGDDGGGLAGVREPRRPLPTTLTGAGAADPAD